jgi:hypothetical protein
VQTQTFFEREQPFFGGEFPCECALSQSLCSLVHFLFFDCCKKETRGERGLLFSHKLFAVLHFTRIDNNNNNNNNNDKE